MSETATQRMCRYPGCDRPAEPGEPGAGRPPEYCDNPDHTRAAAWRARQRATAGASAAEEARPMDAARQRAGLITAQVTGMAEHLISQMHELIGELRTLADPGAAEAQLEAAASEAAEQVAAANGRAIRAEQALRAAVADKEEADAAALEATANAQELQASLSQARHDLDQSRETVTQLQTTIDALTDELTQQRTAKENLEAETRRLNDELERAHAATVAARQEAHLAQAARAEADQRAEAADQHARTEASRAAAAEQATTQVRGELQDVRTQFDATREHLNQLREGLAVATAERDAARQENERERAHGDQRVTDLHQTYERQLTDLRALIPTAQPATQPAPARRSRTKVSADKPNPAPPQGR
jgi:colicin import membrane protein